MDGLKELLAAFETRVKSKVVGSIFLAFIVTNWKVLFYITFEPTNAVTKFNYFDAHTSPWTLAFIPIVSGIALAAILPWVNFLGLKVTEIADRKQRTFKNKSQHLDALEKLEYEARAQEFKARQQKAIVESAKANEEAKEIQDPIIRQKVQEDLQEVKEESSLRVFPVDFVEGLGQVSVEDYKNQLEHLNAVLTDAREDQLNIVEELKTLESTNSTEEENFLNYMHTNDEELDPAEIVREKLDRAAQIELFKTEKNHLVTRLSAIDDHINHVEDDIKFINSDIDKKYGFKL